MHREGFPPGSSTARSRPTCSSTAPRNCTIRPLKWWRQLVEQVARAHPEVLYEFRLQLDERGPQGAPVRVEKILTNHEACVKSAPAAA